MGNAEPDDGSGGSGGVGGAGKEVCEDTRNGWPESDREELLTRWLKKGTGKAKEIEPEEEAEEEGEPEEEPEDVDMTLAE